MLFQPAIFKGYVQQTSERSISLLIEMGESTLEVHINKRTPYFIESKLVITGLVVAVQNWPSCNGWKNAR